MTENASNIPGLRSILLSDRRIFANFSYLPCEPVEVVIGCARALLAPLEDGALRSLLIQNQQCLQALDFRQHTQSHPPTGAPGEFYSLRINELKDWSLSGSTTAQLMFTQREAPCRIQFERSIIVEPANHGLLFQAKLATHRSKAALIVEFREREGNQAETRKVIFKRGYRGGRQPEGYQAVALPLPNWSGHMEVDISIEYQGYIDDGSGMEPFVFLADVYVRENRTVGNMSLTPQLALGTTAPSDGVWLSGFLPVLPTSGGAIELVCGRRCARFTLDEAPDIQIDARQGHTLWIKSPSET